MNTLEILFGCGIAAILAVSALVWILVALAWWAGGKIPPPKLGKSRMG